MYIYIYILCIHIYIYIYIHNTIQLHLPRTSGPVSCPASAPALQIPPAAPAAATAARPPAPPRASRAPRAPRRGGPRPRGPGSPQKLVEVGKVTSETLVVATQ